MLNNLNLYKFDLEDDYKAFSEKYEKRYGKQKLEAALSSLRNINKQGFLRDTGVIYKLYESENQITDEESFKGSLWLNISHNCNLKCRYCYGHQGDYGETRTLMTKEVAKKCIDYWFENINKSKKRFNVTFFGGEPLMNQEVLFFAVEYINSLMQLIGASAKYTVTTNGTILNNRIIKLFKDNEFEFMISVDGLEQIHNRNRPYVSGKKSFKDIKDNIELLRNNFKSLTANMVVTKEDIPFMQESVESLWEMGISNVNISLCCDENVQYDYDDYEVWHKQIQNLCEITYNNIINGKDRLVNNLTEVVRSIHAKKKEVSCSLFINGVFVFSPVGNIYRCYRYVGSEKHKVANIFDEQISFSQQKQAKVVIEKCTKCWAQLLCKDGCPYEHEMFSGDANTPDYYWCNKTKIFLKEGIKLYTRLLINKNANVKSFLG
jgi:radical SAM additional 4Fe4S-binding domain